MKNYTHGYAMAVNRKYKLLESKYDINLDYDKKYVLRFDGVKMTKSFMPQDDNKALFLKTMLETIRLFIAEFNDFKFCYSYCDEISFLLNDKILAKYSYRKQKLLSVLTGALSVCFYKAAINNNLDLKDKIWSFDGRIIELESNDDVLGYFIARQAYSISSHLLSLARKHLDTNTYKSTNQLINELKANKIDYDKIPSRLKYGIIWAGKDYQPSYEFIERKERLTHQLFDDNYERPIIKKEKRSKRRNVSNRMSFINK